MKNLPPSTLALILFVTATTAALLSCGFVPLPLAVGLAYVSSLLFLIRSIVECYRPPDQLVTSLTWGAVIAIVSGLIMPQWHRIGLPIMPLRQANSAIPFLIVAPMLLNGLVPLVRVVRRLARPRV